MSEKTLTSVSATIMLSVGGIFPVPQKLEGFAADNLFGSDAVDQTEVVMGADGKLSGGIVLNPTPFTISLMPNSPSFYVFETWIMAQKTTREVFTCDAEVTIKGTGRKYVLSKGYLTSGKMLPDAKRLLQSCDFKITFESVAPAFI